MAKTGQASSDVKVDGRGPGGRWLPGASPNPAGRPKASYLVSDIAKQHTPEAIATLAKIMGDDNAPHSARVQAAEALLNRAWGKAPVAVDMTVRDGDAGTLHLEALREINRMSVSGIIEVPIVRET